MVGENFQIYWGGGEAKETNEAWHNTLKEGYKHQLQTELTPKLISRASRGTKLNR